MLYGMNFHEICSSMCTKNISLTMVQVMACCLMVPSHNLNQCWSRCLSPYGITRLQWVNLKSSPPGMKSPHTESTLILPWSNDITFINVIDPIDSWQEGCWGACTQGIYLHVTLYLLTKHYIPVACHTFAASWCGERVLMWWEVTGLWCLNQHVL